MAETTQSRFGRLLRHHRLAAGLSQEELAERAGLSARGISDLERGIRQAPQRETIRLVADALVLSDDQRAALELLVNRSKTSTPAASQTITVRATLPVNLPTPSTPLVGRELEVAAVRDLLYDPNVRLLTLTGAGGVGKTRLALRVADELRGEFADGVRIVALSTIGDPALLPSALAHSLGAAETAGRNPEDALIDHLQDAELLLVLDNFEHLVEGAPLVARLLAVCPGLKVLTTSRALLRLSGEHEFPVPPLGLPDGRRVPDVRSLERSDAVSLFVQRARSARPTFGLNPDNAPAVAAICRRLDGLPLAIELAAARIRILPPEVMLSRINRSLSLLTGGARDLPERQRTLRAAIDWSYDLLDDSEKVLFARLSVFSGGWTLDAAEQVCDPGGEIGVMEGIESLVEKSLIDLSGVQGAEPRFGMLATIREYALDRLEKGGEAEVVRQHHADFFATLGERAEPELQGADQAEWLERLEREHDNLRVALAWLLDRGEAERALGLAMSVWRFWDLRGHYSEGRLWLERGLTAGATVSPVMRARALNVAGFLAWMQGDYNHSVELLESSLVMRRELGDPSHIAYTLNNLGLVALDLGEHERASELMRENLSLSQQAEDATGTALCLNNLGYAALLGGDYEQARTYAEESLGIFKDMGNTWGIALALTNLGRAWLELGDYDQAFATLVESLRLSEGLGERRNIAECLEAVAAIRAAAGDAEVAARIYGTVDALREEIGSPLSPAERAHQNRYLDALRTSLGNAAFESAVAEGQATSLENTIAVATED